MRRSRSALQRTPAGPDRYQIRLGTVNTPAILTRAMARVPMRRVAQPSEMAGAVLYRASSASSCTTGAILNVDGGYLSV
jgi:NAD(P)-dependent dehydrogenase (short-subunit alcohol dehydrogenase family)